MPKVLALPPGVKLKVECNKFGQPIDENRSKFSCYLGVLSRKHTYCPINILDWRKVPISNKRDMLNDLEKYFEVPIGIEDCILRSTGSKWRHWKKDLRYDYFDPTTPVIDLVKVRDERVNEHQWKELILYWLSDDGKKASLSRSRKSET